MADTTVKQLHAAITNISATTVTLAGKTDEGFRNIHNIIIAVVIVLVVGFVTLCITVAGMVITTVQGERDYYQQARDSTEEQNDKLDRLVRQQQEILNEQKTLQQSN